MHQIMSADKSNISVRIAITMLLAIYLSPIATNIHCAVITQSLRVGQNAVLLISAAAVCASVLDIDRRYKSKVFDGSCNNALLMKQLPGHYSGGFSPFSTAYSTGFIHRTDRTAIPIRAPPIHYRSIS
jgi:hypothetical protein